MCRCDLLSLVPDPEDQDDTPGNSRAAVQIVDPQHISRVQAGSGGRPSNQVCGLEVVVHRDGTMQQSFQNVNDMASESRRGQPVTHAIRQTGPGGMSTGDSAMTTVGE